MGCLPLAWSRELGAQRRLAFGGRAYQVDLVRPYDASTTHKEAKHWLKLIIALAIAAVGARPVVASQQTDVMAPVRQFVDGFNKTDIKMAEAACANETFIIDDFPPHEW